MVLGGGDPGRRCALAWAEELSAFQAFRIGSLRSERCAGRVGLAKGMQRYVRERW